MVDPSTQYTELLELNRSWRGGWVFPVSWALFGSLMVGALAFCYLVEESQVPTLGLTSWFLVWLLWSWAGARLLQGLVVGPVRTAVVDLGHGALWTYIVVLAGLTIAGLYWSEMML